MNALAVSLEKRIRAEWSANEERGAKQGCDKPAAGCGRSHLALPNGEAHDLVALAHSRCRKEVVICGLWMASRFCKLAARDLLVLLAQARRQGGDKQTSEPKDGSNATQK